MCSINFNNINISYTVYIYYVYKFKSLIFDGLFLLVGILYHLSFNTPDILSIHRIDWYNIIIDNINDYKL